MELDLFSDSKRPKWRKSGAIFGVPGPTLVESGTDKQASQTKYFLTLRPMTPYVAIPHHSAIDWQTGVTICQSFLPSDAVFQNDEDFAPLFQSYQQMYLSKKMAQEFSSAFFMEGTENTTPVTPGTVQIMYHYTSWSDHTDHAQINDCDVNLGQPE